MFSGLIIVDGIGTKETSFTSIDLSSTRQVYNNYTMYFHNTTSANYVFDYSTPYIFNTTLGNKSTNIWDQQRVRMNFMLSPVLAADFECTGDISTIIYINTKGVSANANLNVEVHDVEYKDSGSETSTQVYSGSGGATITSGIDSYQIDISDNPHTFLAGHSIRIYIEIQGGASAEFGLWYGDPKNDSRIIFNAEKTLNIPSVITRDHSDTIEMNFELDVPDKTIKMQAIVTDVFGGYDINEVLLNLYDPSDNPILTNVSMDKIAGTPISYSNTYESLWNYSGAAIGEYTIVVWATDNNGFHNYYHKQKYTYSPYSTTGSGSFFVGGLPTNGEIHVFDSKDLPLAGALVEARKAGRVIASNITDANGDTRLGIYKGLYDIAVFWQGVEVGAEVDYNLLDDFNLTLKCNVFYPEFKVVDNADVPLEGANIYTRHPNGTYRISPYITDENGTISLVQVPQGYIQLIVKWRDVEVADENILVNANGLLATIKCQVYSVDLKLLDSKEIGLPGAQLVVSDSISRLILDSRISNLAGETTSQLPVGLYNVTVYWRQAVVQQLELDVSDDMTLDIDCWVYYVNFRALDPRNASLDNAQIVLTLPDTGGVLDSVMTNMDGYCESRLPVGLADIVVNWKEADVHSSQILISGDVSATSPIILTCEVYYLGLQVTDSKNVSLAEARIIITDPADGSVLDTQVTGYNGSSLIRLPKGEFDISVSWYGIEVYNESSYAMTADTFTTLECKVYYATIKAIDSQSIDLAEAKVLVTHKMTNQVLSNKITNNNGSTEIRVPIGTYEIVIDWRGIEVSRADYDIDNNKQITITCSVFYYTIRAVDDRTLPLNDALVHIRHSKNSDIWDSIITAADGKATSRIPIGEYDLEVYWKDVLVYSEEEYLVNKDEDLDKSCTVHYLTIKAKENDGEAVSDVSIIVEDATTEILESARTDSKGIAEFRLPAGTYLVSARLQTSHLLKKIDESHNETVVLSASQELEFKFEEYPPSIVTTPVFWIVAISVLMFIILLVLVLLFLKARSKPAVSDEEPAQPSDTEDEDLDPPPPDDDELDPPPPEDDLPVDITEEDIDKESWPEDDIKDLELDQEGEVEASEPKEPSVEEESPLEEDSPVDEEPPVEEESPVEVNPDKRSEES